jgi:hypothetical protein
MLLRGAAHECCRGGGGGGAMSKILGINRRSYPSEDHGFVDVSVVLVAGSIGDYSAYAGQGDPEWIARYGDKISFAEACCHFPGGQLKESRYGP